MRSLTKKARRNKIGAIIKQPQYLQEVSLKAEVFNEKEDISSRENSLTARLIKPCLIIKLDKTLEKTLNKVALPLKKQRSGCRTDASLNLPYGAQKRQKLGSSLAGYRMYK